MDARIIFWQVIAAYAFALVGGGLSASLRLSHKPLCALISFAAGTLCGVTLFAIIPESLENCTLVGGAPGGGDRLPAFFLYQQICSSRLPGVRGKPLR